MSNSNKWLFDFTINYIGSTRIPTHEELDYEYSDQFSQINCNITRKWDQFDFYVGAENITNYVQKKPILGSDDWSSSTSSFDASLVYAPVHGRMIYLGFRYRIK